MTKTQAEKAVRLLVQKIEEAMSMLEDLKNEVEETAENIEPYENKDDLTPQQEERLEWFEELGEALDSAEDNLTEITDELSNY